MAFDAGFTKAIINELSASVTNARVEKIFQPSKESVLFVLRGERNGADRGATMKLLIDAGSANPRMSLADPVFDNPKVPPMFCMLLRKHLGGARITSVRQIGFDRAAEFEFETRDELGYLTKKYIYAEIMGKFSNLIFCDAEKKIISAVRTNDITSGSKRPVIPGALYTPPPPTPPMPQMGMPASGGLSFQTLERALQENGTVTPADLKDGRVPEAADILFVVAPDKLDQSQLFAVDQFLMQGGTVIVASAPFAPNLRGNISVAPQASGLKEWLASYGINQDEAMVLDPQNSPFPVPVERNVGGIPIRQMHLLDYPYFVDVRPDGMAQGEAPTVGLNQLTLSWASPITVDEAKAKGRKITRLIESSRSSWTSPNADVLPDFKTHPQLGFEQGKDGKRHLLGVVMEGQFTSFFAGKPSPLAKDAEPAKPAGQNQQADANDPNKPKEEAKPSITGVIERSPDSARIILVGSSSFLADELLEVISSVDRTQYQTPLRFAENLVDWSLEDRQLLALRSRGGQFSRTLPPMSEASQMSWEYANYALAILGLLAIFLIRRLARASAQRRYLAILKPQGV